MNNQKLLSEVVKIIEEVGQVLLKMQQSVKEIKKERKDFLTDADLKSNSLITERLQKLTPEVLIYSEEGDEKIKESDETLWIVDPLDGTINYSHQDIFWGISIALVENQQVQLSVIFLPSLGQLVGVSRENEIITKGKITLAVSSESEISKAQIWTDWSKKSASATIDIFLKLAENSRYPQIRLCSSASFVWLATGKISGYIEPAAAPEDIAAGSLIVEKAGGRVTDLAGKPWTPFSSSIVASNGLLHNQILEAIKS